MILFMIPQKSYQRVLLGFYPLVVILASLLGEYEHLPREHFFTDKRNFLNRYFVKFGWAWTVLPLTGFICLHRYTQPRGPTSPSLRRSLLLIALCTCYWVCMTQWFFGPSLFSRIFHHWPWALCSHPAHDEHHTCTSNGHEWLSFDVSGHCFLLILGSLLLWEELRSRYRLVFKKWNVGVRLLFSLNVIVLFLWTWMLIVTCLYYHTWNEKLLGTCFGLVGWLLFYDKTYHRRCRLVTL